MAVLEHRHQLMNAEASVDNNFELFEAQRVEEVKARGEDLALGIRTCPDHIHGSIGGDTSDVPVDRNDTDGLLIHGSPLGPLISIAVNFAANRRSWWHQSKKCYGQSMRGQRLALKHDPVQRVARCA